MAMVLGQLHPVMVSAIAATALCLLAFAGLQWRQQRAVDRENARRRAEYETARLEARLHNSLPPFSPNRVVLR